MDASISIGFLFDIFANVFLFIPFGYLSIRTNSRIHKFTVLQIFLLGNVISSTVELFQVYCHNRFSTMTDLCNSIIEVLIGAEYGRRFIRKCLLSESNFLREETGADPSTV